MSNEDTKLILAKLDQIDVRFDNLENRFDNLENRVDDLKNEVDGLSKSLKNDLEKSLMDRFFVFEQRYDRAISALLETLNSRSQLEQENSERMKRFEQSLDFFRAFTLRQEETVSRMETGIEKWYQDNPEVPKVF